MFRQRPNKGPLVLLTLFMALVALLQGGKGAAYLLNTATQWLTRSWEATPCEVLSASIGDRGDVGHSGRDSLSVGYIYKVQYLSHRGTTYTYIPLEKIPDAQELMKETVRDLKSNRKRECYVNPRDPSQAVLVRGAEREDVFYPYLRQGIHSFVFAAALVLGIAVAWAARALRLRRTEAAWRSEHVEACVDAGGIPEWDVEDIPPDEEAEKPRAKLNTKSPFEVLKAASKGGRERPTWVTIPLVPAIIMIMFGIPGTLYRMDEANGWPLRTWWDAAEIPLVIFAGSTLVLFGITQMMSICKRVLGWGTPRNLPGGVGQRRKSLRREIASWVLALVAPAVILAVIAEPTETPWVYRISAVPTVEGHFAALLVILMAACHWLAFALGILEFYLHTWVYRLRFGRVLRERRRTMPHLAERQKWDYKRRNVDTFLVEWVKHPGQAKVIPYFKRDWSRLVWFPPASPVFDGWRSVFGYPEHILSGERDGRRFSIFDYHDCIDFAFPVTTSPAYLLDQKPSDFSAISIEEDYALPALLVYPEALWDKVAKRMGGTDIDLESIEFSDQFRIWSDDRKFAYDVCHGRMMEFLLAHPDMAFRIDGNVRSFRFPGLVHVEELPDRLETALAFCDLLPEYVRSESDAAQRGPGRGDES